MAKTKKKRTDFPHISIKCEICGKSKRGQLFYSKRGNNQNLDDPDTFVPICRDCFLKDFVPEDPKTFLWMMKEQDRPFIQSEWVNTVNSIRAQYPDGSKDDTIYGTYMRNIGTSPDYKHFGFDDSGTVEEIVAERKREKAEQERIEREEREKRADAAPRGARDDRAVPPRDDGRPCGQEHPRRLPAVGGNRRLHHAPRRALHQGRGRS